MEDCCKDCGSNLTEEGSIVIKIEHTGHLDKPIGGLSSNEIMVSYFSEQADCYCKKCGAEIEDYIFEV